MELRLWIPTGVLDWVPYFRFLLYMRKSSNPFFFPLSLLLQYTMEAPATLNDQVVQLVFGLANLKVDIPIVNFSLPVLDVLFAILINYSYRSALGVSHNQVGWYQGLLATLVMATGGGCTVAVLRGEPIGILKSNEFWGIHW